MRHIVNAKTIYELTSLKQFLRYCNPYFPAFNIEHYKHPVKVIQNQANVIINV